MNILGLMEEENDNNFEDDEMGSDEELEDKDDNENNINNDMSDLKDDDESSEEENTLNKVAEEVDNNKLTKLFTQKLKEKKVIMDEARKQLPYTFTGNDFNIKKSIMSRSLLI